MACFVSYNLHDVDPKCNFFSCYYVYTFFQIDISFDVKILKLNLDYCRLLRRIGTANFASLFGKKIEYGYEKVE